MTTPKLAMCDTRRPDGCYIEYERVTIEDTDADPSDKLFFQDEDCPEVDQARLDAFNRGEWEMIGVRARAHVTLVQNGAGFSFSIESAGIWSVESDSGEDYLRELYEEQIEELKDWLRMLKVD